MKLTRQQHLLYDIIISTLAFTAVILVIIDLSDELNAWQIRLDQFILMIFTLDDLVRCILR